MGPTHVFHRASIFHPIIITHCFRMSFPLDRCMHSLYLMRGEFMRAKKILSHSRDIRELCEEFVEGTGR